MFFKKPSHLTDTAVIGGIFICLKL